jgi:hypothetical protein
MIRALHAAFGALILAATPALAEDVQKAPPPAPPYKKVSELVKLPDFVPGLGELYVDPKTLPDGPFLAYDHQGKLVSTVYMIPIKSLDEHKKISDLKAPGGTVTNVDIVFNAGHPSVEEPHYHIILWHVPEAEESAVEK